MTTLPVAHRASLVVSTLCAALALASFFVGAPWAASLFAGVAVVLPVALMVLGAARADSRRSLGRVGWTLALLLLAMAGAMTGLFLVERRPAVSLSLLVYGLFLLPLAISTLGYAWTFDRHGLDPDDLDALRRRFKP